MVLYPNSSSKHPAFDGGAPLKYESQTLRYMRACVQESANRKHMHKKGSKVTKFTIEQARRRSIIKLTTNMMTFALARPPPPQIKQENKDSATLDKDRSLPKTLDLPLYLGLPEYEEVPQASIEAVDPSLVNTSVGYIRDTLIKFAISPGMYMSLQRCTAKDRSVMSAGSLPKEISMTTDDIDCVLPTHMMAVHGPRPTNDPEARTKVTLYPVHSLILAAYCAKLPAFPPLEVADPVETPTSRQFTLPIRPLYLHSPKTFPAILEYLYLRSPDILLQRLIPLPLPMVMIHKKDQHASLARFIGSRLSIPALFCQVSVVHGIWQNTCALGIFDDLLWGVISFAWKLAVMSLAVATRKPGVFEAYEKYERHFVVDDETEEEESEEEEEEEEEEEAEEEDDDDDDDDDDKN